MTSENISDDIRRFILAIPSIPYLEAMLLLRSAADRPWSEEQLAQHLFISRERAANLLKDLCGAGICSTMENDDRLFQYRPQFAQLDSLIERLASLYAKNLIEVTNIIHANAHRNQRVQQFADAFIWRKEK